MRAAQFILLEETQDLIESVIRARRQVTANDLCTAVNLGICHLRRYLRALLEDGRVHRIRPMRGAGPASGVWAPGPDPLALSSDDALEIGTSEPIHVCTKRWPAPKVRFTALELCLFGRATAPEVRV